MDGVSCFRVRSGSSSSQKSSSRLFHVDKERIHIGEGQIEATPVGAE